MHCASLNGRVDVVKLQLKSEADVNPKNKLKDENDEDSNEPMDINAQSHNKNTPRVDRRKTP